MNVLSVSDLPPAPPGKSGWPWTEQISDTALSRASATSQKQDLPCISIVTPSYNQAEYIEETIRSVLLQGYPNLEYIVIDGGSTDGSAEIIRTYTPWLAYWVSEPDRGQSDALNKGFARATGELVGWQNSDDLYLPGAFWRMVDEYRRSPNSDLVFGNVRVIDRDGRLIREQRYTRFSRRCLLFEGLNVSNQSALWRRSLHTRAGPLDVDLHYEMDLDFFLRTAEIGRFRFVRQTFGSMRVHEKAKTQHSFPQSDSRGGAATRPHGGTATSTRGGPSLREGQLIRQRFGMPATPAHPLLGVRRWLCLMRRAALYVLQGDLTYVAQGAVRRWRERH